MVFASRCCAKGRHGAGQLSRAVVAPIAILLTLGGCVNDNRTTSFLPEHERRHSESFAAVPSSALTHRGAAAMNTPHPIYFKAMPQFEPTRPVPAAYQRPPRPSSGIQFDPCAPSQGTTIKPYGSSVLRGQKTMRDASSFLESQLGLGGYPQFTYVSCPDGFVMITPAEWFERDGTPNLQDRWVSGAVPTPYGRSLGTLWNDYWYGREGQFRYFLLSVRSSGNTSLEPPTSDDLKAIFSQGARSLDPKREAVPLTSQMRLSVILYVFEVRKGATPKFVDQTKIPLGEHLAKSGVFLGGR
jgi:hypothetical protein